MSARTSRGPVAALAAVALAVTLLAGCSRTAPVAPATAGASATGPTATAGGTLDRPLYSLTVPPGWADAGAQARTGQIETYLTKGDITAGTSFSVFVDVSGRHPEDVLKESKAGLPGAKDAAPIQVGGKQLLGLQAEAEGLVLHQYMVEVDGKLVALNWSWPKDKDASGDVNAILGSFHWKK